MIMNKYQSQSQSQRPQSKKLCVQSTGDFFTIAPCLQLYSFEQSELNSFVPPPGQQRLDAAIQGEAAKASTLQSAPGAQSFINYQADEEWGHCEAAQNCHSAVCYCHFPWS